MTSASITEIAAALKVSDRTVRKWRNKFNWQPVNETGVDIFDITTIPGLKPEERERICNYLEAAEESKLRNEEFQRELAEAAAIKAKKDAETAKRDATPPESLKFTTAAGLVGTEAGRKAKEKELLELADASECKQMCLAMFQELPEKSKKAAQAKFAMLDALENFLKAAGYKGRVKDGKQCWNWKGVQKFCDAFLDGSLSIAAEVAGHFMHKGKRSLVPVSLNNWRKQYEEQGLYGLADHYASRKGQTSLTVEQQEFCVSMFTEKPGVSVRSICKAMATRFKGVVIPERSTIGRYLDNWKAKNEGLYLSLTNPDAWRSKYMLAFGNASENVTRLNQMWEADSTPADIMTLDGRACIIGIIDVWSRRLKLLVSPTSKSTAIGMLLRRCILDWGMVEEEFRTDNGADYTSFYMERVLEHLNVHHELCPPFTPECKPHIERAFKTFSHGILPFLDGYIGHNVAERKAIEARASFAKRLMTKGETVEVKMSATELQSLCDRWCESMYHTEPHNGLDGLSPLSKVRSWTKPVKRISNEHALDVLLSPAPSNDGWRVITKKGLSVTFGAAQLRYISADFAGHEGERVRVLIDVTDLGHASIFREDGAFLCIAEDPVWNGISSQELAMHAKNRQKALLTEQRREHREMVKRSRIDGIAEEILKDREEQAAKIADLPRPSSKYTTPALEQARLAVVERERRTSIPALSGIIELPPEVLESEAREAEKQQQHDGKRGKVYGDQYELYEDVLRMKYHGEADAVELAWIKDYEHMLDNPKKAPCGLMVDDPYLLKHWGRISQSEAGQ